MGKATNLKQLRLDELSLVQRGANKGALVTLHKRADPEIATLAKFGGALVACAADGDEKSFEALLAANEAERKRWEANDKLWPLFSALSDSLRAIVTSGDDRTAKVAQIRTNVEAFMASVRDALPDVESELQKALRDNPAAAGVMKEAGARPGPETRKEGDLMKTVEQLTAELATMTQKAETATAALQTAQSERDAAVKKAADATAEVDALKKAAEIAKADEFIEVDGVKLYKSVAGEQNFAFAKAQQTRLLKSEEAVELTKFEKAAESDYGNLPGEPVAKAKALRAIAKMGDEDRKIVETMLKAGNAAQMGLTTELGKANPGPAPGSAIEKLDALAKKHAADNKIPFTKAYSEVLDTPEGAALYAKSEDEKKKAA